VNGDGFADLIVGATGVDVNGFNDGASYVVFGKAQGFEAEIDLSALNGRNGFQITGEAGGDNSGFPTPMVTDSPSPRPATSTVTASTM
jgi:hypothetical protein